MKITVWRAFSGNNSGSYTLVARFASAELARAAARDLSRLVELAGREDRGGPDPVAVYAAEEALPGPGSGAEDDWPLYDDTPVAVEIVGRQVMVHHPYTVTLPRQLGELVYHRRGRVEVELAYTHGQDLAQLRFHWPGPDTGPALRLLARLRSPPPGLAALLIAPAPVIGFSQRGGGATVRYAAAFGDIPAGVRALRDLPEAAGAAIELKVWEAPLCWEEREGGSWRSVTSHALDHLRAAGPAGPPPGAETA